MKLKIEDLLSLEDYDDQREVIKKDLINHKKKIELSLSGNMLFYYLKTTQLLNIKFKRCLE